MSRYSLTYVLPADLQKRAMLSWAKPMRTTNQRLRLFALGIVIGGVASGCLVMLLQADVVTVPILLSWVVGFYAAVLLWFVSSKRSIGKLMRFAEKALLRQGTTKALFTSDEVTFRNDVSNGAMDWCCFDAVMALPDATVLRAGALVYPVPDAALPDDVTPQRFRDDLSRWMEAAR